MAIPPHPRTLEELLAWPAALYSRFEAAAPLVKASLQREIADRFRSLLRAPRHPLRLDAHREGA